MDPIQAHTGLVLPKDYHALVQADVWVFEGEWIPTARVLSWELPSRGPVLERLLPFAFTNAGDAWCWALDHLGPTGEPEIWACSRESDDALVFAPHIAGWVFRSTLAFAACTSDDPAELAELRDTLATAAGLLAGLGHATLASTLTQRAGPVRPAEVAALVAAAFGPRYLERRPWQRADPLATASETDLRAAEARTRAELDAWRFEDATIRAADAFREKRYSDFIDALEPFEDRISATQAAKLALARRRVGA